MNHTHKGPMIIHWVPAFHHQPKSWTNILRDFGVNVYDAMMSIMLNISGNLSLGIWGIINSYKCMWPPPIESISSRSAPSTWIGSRFPSESKYWFYHWNRAFNWYWTDNTEGQCNLLSETGKASLQCNYYSKESTLLELQWCSDTFRKFEARPGFLKP